MSEQSNYQDLYHVSVSDLLRLSVADQRDVAVSMINTLLPDEHLNQQEEVLSRLSADFGEIVTIREMLMTHYGRQSEAFYAMFEEGNLVAVNSNKARIMLQDFPLQIFSVYGEGYVMSAKYEFGDSFYVDRRIPQKEALLRSKPEYEGIVNALAYGAVNETGVQYNRYFSNSETELLTILMRNPDSYASFTELSKIILGNGNPMEKELRKIHLYKWGVDTKLRGSGFTIRTHKKQGYSIQAIPEGE